MTSMDMRPGRGPVFPDPLLAAAREVMSKTPRPSDREGKYEALLSKYGLTGGYSMAESCSVHLRSLADAIGDTEFLAMLNLDYDFSTGNF